MGEIINLRKARKHAKRRLNERHAAENRVHYGRSKAERTFDSAREVKAHRELDQHRVEKGDER